MSRTRAQHLTSTFAAQYNAKIQFRRAIHTPVIDQVRAMVAVMHAHVMLVAACSGAGPGTGSGCSDVRCKSHLQSSRQGLQPPSRSPGMCGHTQGILLHPRAVSCLLAARSAARILVSRQQQHTCTRACVRAHAFVRGVLLARPSAAYAFASLHAYLLSATVASCFYSNSLSLHAPSPFLCLFRPGRC